LLLIVVFPFVCYPEDVELAVAGFIPAGNVTCAGISFCC
jgi:hypothetical protein